LFLINDYNLCIFLTKTTAVAAFFRGYGSGVMGEKIIMDIRRDLFNAIMLKDIEFFDKTRTGDLCNFLI